MPDLKSDQEEADTRLLLHAKYASTPETRIVIHSPDTDVLVLSAAHFDRLGSKELWFRTGAKDLLRLIPVHKVSQAQGPTMCDALPALHALTGCDSTSSLQALGRRKPGMC